jgi:hypothetical protein
MYFDDPFDPNNDNDLDLDSMNQSYQVEDINDCATITSSNVSKNRKDKRRSKDTENADPGLVVVKRVIKKPVIPGLKIDVLRIEDTGPTFYSAKITQINALQSGTTYDVLLDQGDVLNGVSPSKIHFPSSVTKGYQTKIPFYFTSVNPNMVIRNAVTGQYEFGNKTGSFQEDLFFKMTLATGEGKSRDALHLYYDNPEQYERHFFCTVPDETKKRWNDKFIATKIRVETLKKHRSESGYTVIQ